MLLASGALRPQTFEESLTCAGCYVGTGRSIDGVFSYRAGDEFRANGEPLQRFFPGGVPDEDAIAALAQRIGPLADPSPKRALALDKAYRVIVEEQSYDKGRAPVLAPLDEVLWKRIAPDTETGVVDPFS